MKTFFSKYFDLRSYDNWNLGLFFLSFIPFALFDIFIPDENYNLYIILTAGINLALLINDRNILNRVHAKVPSFWWFFIMPLYMLRREQLNKNNSRVAFVYILLMVLSFSSGLWIDNSKNPERVAEDVCPVVNTIDIFKSQNITCNRAYNFTEQYDGFWKGRVHLSNNMIVSVTADYNQDKHYVYVQTQGLVDDAGY